MSISCQIDEKKIMMILTKENIDERIFVVVDAQAILRVQESWGPHYENEQALKKAFLALPEVISSAHKARSTYDETSRRIDAL
jgi:hypothetical protein